MSTNDPGSHAAESEVTDPVCGMIVDPKKAKRRVHEGREYLFCSRRCRKEFKADPEGHISGEIRRAADEARRAAAEAASREHVCPVNPDVHQTGPGSCPRCGAPLSEASSDSEAS